MIFSLELNSLLQSTKPPLFHMKSPFRVRDTVEENQKMIPHFIRSFDRIQYGNIEKYKD